MHSKPRFPITRDEIATVVAHFYGKVADDPVLSPIYLRHIKDWDTHVARLREFWENMIFGDGSKGAETFLIHLRTGEIRPEHFERWCAIFRENAQSLLAPVAASAWGLIAERLSEAYQESARHNLSAMAFGHRDDLENSPLTDRPMMPDTEGRAQA